MKKLFLILYFFFTIISLQAQNTDWTNYSLILTDCKDYSEVIVARDYIAKLGGNVAIIGSKNVMLGWIDPSIASQLVGYYGITAIHYKPIDLSTLITDDRQALQTVAFFNSATSGALKKQLLDEKDKQVKKLDYYDGLPHPQISYDDYLKNLEQKNLNIQNLKKENQLLTFKPDGSLLTGNSDVMVGTVAVAVFLVESNGAVDQNLYTWSSADEDSMYQRTLRDLSWWSNMATKYGKTVSFNVIPHYHTDPVSQQPYEPILHSTSEDSLWIGSIMNNLGFRTGRYSTRVEAYNTWLRSTYHTDWAYTIFFAYNPSPAPYSFTNGYGGYAYFGGPYTQILFTWFDRKTVAHESGHIFWAPDEYYQAGYGGCGDGATNTKSGFPDGNCEVANVNSVDCMMKYISNSLCAYSPAHIGWTTEVPHYTVETNPPGLLLYVKNRPDLEGVQRVSPQEFPWGRGSQVEISVVTPQILNGKRYDFLSWNDGGAQSHSITIPNSSTSYMANFSLVNETPQTWLLYQMSNALPTPNVKVVSIDGQNNVWVGTDGGLSKFDGENWKTYNKANSGIPFNTITSVATDTQGNKWIGMTPYWNGSTNVGGGLAKLDGTTWTVYNTSNSGLPENYVLSIAIDGSVNKWIGTFGGGLAKFNGTIWTVYNSLNSGLPDNVVWSIAIDGLGNKWIGTSGGLAKFDGTSWTVYNTSNSGLPDNTVLSIAIDGSGNKWIGTWNGGLAKFDGTNWTVYNTSNSGLPDKYVNSIAIDVSENKWIGTYDSGLAKFDGTNWVIYKTSNSGLPNNYVTSIAIDGSGNKWISTFFGGLAKFDDINWKVYTTSNLGLPDNLVRSIAIDGSGNKWIGTWGSGGLAKFDGTNWTVYNTSNSGLPANYINTIAIDGSENKWIGTGGGLAIFDGTNWTVYNISNSGLPDNHVLSIAIDGSGNKWIGTYSGLVKFDGTNWTVYNTSNSGLPSNDVSSIAIDNSGNKWIGTGGGGLARFDGTNWTVYNISNSGLPFNNVTSIVIDGSGNKWIGTGFYDWGGGLAKFDGTIWTVYNSSNSGLPHNSVSSIAIDGSGNKWIGTFRGGLAVYNGGGLPAIDYPTKPQLLTPLVNQINQSRNIMFKWKKVKDAKKYLIQLSKDQSFITVAKSDSTFIDTTKIISNLSDGQKYFWKVLAKNIAGISPWSDSWNFTTQIIPPSNLTLQRAGLKAITLKWNDNSNNEEGYLIERKQLPQTNYSFLDSLKTVAITYLDNKVEQGPTYYYRIKAYTKFVQSDYSNEASLVMVGVEDQKIPTEYSLSQNYPNPFNPNTVIKFDVPKESFITLKVYDILGREVVQLINEEKKPGKYQVTFNASKLSSGVYFYRLLAGSFVETKKLILIK